MALATLGQDIDRLWRQGEAQPISVLCVDPLTGDLIDLTGASAHYKLALPTPITKSSTVPGQISLDATNSIVTVNIYGSDVPGANVGVWDHELAVLLADGSVRTIFQGLVEFVPAVAASFFLP